MKFLLIVGLMIGSTVLAFGQDLSGVTDVPSEADITLTPLADEPLYVVSSSGTAKIITKEQFQKINHEQIDYMQSINDPSSIYIYGDKARNGVVLVVMKGSSFMDKDTPKKRRQR